MLSSYIKHLFLSGCVVNFTPTHNFHFFSKVSLARNVSFIIFLVAVVRYVFSAIPSSSLWFSRKSLSSDLLKLFPIKCTSSKLQLKCCHSGLNRNIAAVVIELLKRDSYYKRVYAIKQILVFKKKKKK